MCASSIIIRKTKAMKKKQKQNTFVHTRVRIYYEYTHMNKSYVNRKYISTRVCFSQKMFSQITSLFYEQAERQDDDGFWKGNIKIEVTNLC